jgi:ribonuclease HII
MPPKIKKSSSASAASEPTATTLPLSREVAAVERHNKLINVIGVDEAGRGPLAGPVVCAAVAILDPTKAAPVLGVRDSKQVEEEERETLYPEILEAEKKGFLVSGVAVLDHNKIDEINIFQATLLGMTQAVEEVQSKLSKLADKKKLPCYVFIDGPKVPNQICAKVDEWCEAAEKKDKSKTETCMAIQGAEGVIGGDAKVYSIAAASLIAKVTRDRIMRDLDKKFPEYGFAIHKGYGVPAHVAAIFKHGPCEIHRRSFNPVKTMVAKEKAAAEAAASSSSSSSSAEASASADGGSARRDEARTPTASAAVGTKRGRPKKAEQPAQKDEAEAEEKVQVESKPKKAKRSASSAKPEAKARASAAPPAAASSSSAAPARVTRTRATSKK